MRFATKITYLAIVLLSLAGVGCKPQNSWHNSEGAVWNTVYHITYCGPRDMSDSIQSIFHEIELSLSPFNEQSIVSRINHGEMIETDTHFREVFILSQEINRNTDGLFDPTISPVINLWKFGYTGKVDIDSVWEPTAQEIDSALSLVGIGECSLLSDNTLQKKSPSTSFNFSAITKGYACDKIAEMLRRNGADGAMVEIGGEIALFGKNPQGEDWRIQIDTPQLDQGVPEHERLDVLNITDCGIATSGNYRNYHQSSEGIVGHTIDPKTGRPMMGEVLSVSVIAPTCAEADAYSTSAMAAGSVEKASKLLQSAGVKALIVSGTTNGEFLVTRIE